MLWKTSEKCPKFPEVRHQTANIKYYSNAIGGKFWRIIVPTYGCVMHRYCSRPCLKWPVHNAFWITRNTTYTLRACSMRSRTGEQKEKGKKNSITIECLSPTSVKTIMMRNRTRCACLRKRAFAPAVTTTSARGHSCDWEFATQSILGAIPIDALGVLNGIMH